MTPVAPEMRPTVPLLTAPAYLTGFRCLGPAFTEERVARLICAFTRVMAPDEAFRRFAPGLLTQSGCTDLLRVGAAEKLTYATGQGPPGVSVREFLPSGRAGSGSAIFIVPSFLRKQRRAPGCEKSGEIRRGRCSLGTPVGRGPGSARLAAPLRLTVRPAAGGCLDDHQAATERSGRQRANYKPLPITNESPTRSVPAHAARIRLPEPWPRPAAPGSGRSRNAPRGWPAGWAAGASRPCSPQAPWRPSCRRCRSDRSPPR